MTSQIFEKFKEQAINLLRTKERSAVRNSISDLEVEIFQTYL